MEIGFIGLGNMGTPMVRRLLQAGHGVLVHDIDRTLVERLVAEGARPADSAAELASRVALLLCSLPTPGVVETVLTGPGGVIEGSTVKVVADLSTTGAVRARSIAAALAGRGVALVDAPVSGGTPGASAGTLAIMVSGPRAAYDTAEPALRVIGSNHFYLGERQGLGHTMKLVNNMLAASNCIAAFEALVFGAKAGLEAKTMLDVINASSGRSYATEVKVPQCILDRSFPMRFTTSLLHKDVRLGLEEAEAAGAATWVIPMVRQFLAFAIAQGDGEQDYARAIRHYEAWAGAEFGTAGQP